MHKIKKHLHIILAGVILLLTSCGNHPSTPSNCTQQDALPSIYPDYTNISIPSNIAPLNFMLTNADFTECMASFTLGDGNIINFGNGNKVLIDESEWRNMIASSKGKSMKITVYGKKGEQWYAFLPFEIKVENEVIDPYISYRLIEPGYAVYNQMSIAQRSLETFDETDIYNNKMTGDLAKGQCINCHSYQNHKTDNMLFHVRASHGGTIMVVDGKPRSVNLKRDYTISAGVYPAWHPTEKLVAFSTDNTHQWFHTSDPNKIEVFDWASDLILYDIAKDQVDIIANDSAKLEVFPTWTPDGKWLYYCSADALPVDSTEDQQRVMQEHYENLRYNIYKKSFNAATKQFGEEQLVYNAAEKDHSATLPRISPDGKYLVFAEGNYGCFNIWHHEADVRILALNDTTKTPLPMEVFNSENYAESYPTWSSNGKWLMCASRRDDGNFSRVYIAYFDGKSIHKPFLLPQQDPEHNTLRLQSYNRPEFMMEPVKITPKEFARVVLTNP